MAPAPSIADWAIENADRLDLKVDRLTWADAWIPGLWDFFVEIKVGGQTFNGRGSALTDDEAFTKAVAEAMERTAIPASTLSSGFAAHVDVESAKSSALKELVERDAFFCHWLTKTPFLQKLDEKSCGLSLGDRAIAHIVEQAETKGVQLQIAKMKSFNRLSAYLCVASGTGAVPPFGTVIGLGCEADPDQAIRHAVVECLRTSVAWISGNYSGGEALSRAAFERIAAKGALEHERFGLSLDAVDLLAPNLDSLQDQIYIEPDMVADFTIIELPEPVADAPLIIARATSPRVQNAFFGPVAPAHVNLIRLAEFCGRPVCLNDLRLDPHPFG